MSNLGRLLRYLKPYRLRVGFAVGLMLLVTLTALPMPRVTQYMLDVALPHKNLKALNVIFWLVVGIYIVRGLVSFTLN
jgi:ABC-type multidrug transport system fused ATPase/permease subunit